MLIKPDALQHWMNNFYGYGSWSAPFWFVGYEESGGDLPEEVGEKLNYFLTTHPSPSGPTLCNLRELYKHVTFRIEGPRLERFKNFYDHRFGSDPVQHGFWKNLTTFSFAYQGKEIPDLLSYQREKFASPTSQEALIELFPLPAHNHAWYYSWLDLPELPFLKSRTLYEQHIFQDRIKAIFAQIQNHRPELVLMYSMENINALKKSAQQFFPGATFKVVKAVPGKIPQFHRADVEGTTLVITTQRPGLRHNRIETGFDWEAFGKSLTK